MEEPHTGGGPNPALTRDHDAAVSCVLGDGGAYNSGLGRNPTRAAAGGGSVNSPPPVFSTRVDWERES